MIVKKRDYSTDQKIFWISAIRAISMFMVILHNWCTVFFHSNENEPLAQLMKLFLPFSGSFVQLFFVVSGCGLVIWYYHKESISWKNFYKRRLKKIMVPYWIAVTFFFVLINFVNRTLPEIFHKSFGYETLIKYLLLIQNFFPEDRYFNSSFWFMPIVVSFYLIFPSLIYIQRKRNNLTLVLASVAVSTVCMFVWKLLGYQISNSASIFPFFLPQFIIGILIGKIYIFNHHYFDKIFTSLSFIVGIMLYFIAFILAKYLQYGYYINDIFSALGLFLIVINVAKHVYKIELFQFWINKYSTSSYALYLIHLFIISAFLKQYNINLWKISLNPLQVLILGIGFNITLFLTTGYLRQATVKILADTWR